MKKAILLLAANIALLKVSYEETSSQTRLRLSSLSREATAGTPAHFNYPAFVDNCEAAPSHTKALYFLGAIAPRALADVRAPADLRIIS